MTKEIVILDLLKEIEELEKVKHGRKGKHIAARLTLTEYRDLLLLANYEQMTKSDAVRLLIREGAERRNLPPSD